MALVLVVDDEAIVRMLIVDVLDELGYRSLEAEDGPSGLEIMRSGEPVDLLVTDVGLPGGIDGRQLADAARALRPGLKVLFVTGYGQNMVLAGGQVLGESEVINKPFSMDALVARIQSMLKTP